MNRRSFVYCGLVLLTCLGLSVPVHAEGKLPSNRIRWQKNIQTAHKLAIKNGKPILIVFAAEWCFFCHKLEKETLRDPGTSQFINDRFVAVRLDLEKDKKIAKILDIKSLPASIVVNADADLLGTIVGYQQPRSYANNLRAALRVHRKLQQAAAERVME